MRPSVLDRLAPIRMADRPEEGDARPQEGIRRDLEDLLNTRNDRVSGIRKSHPLAADSILGFGVPDLRVVAAQDGLDGVCRKIEEAIRRYEPRLSNPEVTLTAAPQPSALEVHLQIRATLRSGTKEEIVLNSVLKNGAIALALAS